MNDSLNNKELVVVGHQFAKAMSSDTPIIDMAKIVSRLAERLDCTTAALREMTKQRDALAAENAGLKQNTPDLQAMMTALDVFFADDEVPERAMLAAYTRDEQFFFSDKQTGNYHPTQKPLKLVKDIIETYSNPGDVVLDFTMGSGTCGIACKNTGRSFIGIEKET